MKKLFIILCLFTISAVSSYSQCPTPLSWDYPSIPYTPGGSPGTVILNYNPLCVMTYEYCYRTTPCCYDFAITKITFKGDCDHWKDNVSLDSLMEMAVTDLVANENPWGVPAIPECPDLSNGTWRQSSAVCWSEWFWDPVLMVWTRVPCPDDHEERWCWTYYRFCWELDPINNVRRLNKYVTSYDAGGPDCSPWIDVELDCISRCVD